MSTSNLFSNSRKLKIVLFVISINYSVQCIAKQNNFELNISVGLRMDFKYSEKVVPVTHFINPPLSPPGTIYVPEVSGMKYYSKLLPQFGIVGQYRIKKNSPIHAIVNLELVRRGHVYKEHLQDDLNIYSQIDYDFNFLDIGIGVGYHLKNWNFSGQLIRQVFLNSETENYLKDNSTYLESDVRSHWFLTQPYLFRLTIAYNFKIGEIKSAVGFFIEPYKIDSKVFSIGINYRLKII